jgi:hypothetical protein
MVPGKISWNLDFPMLELERNQLSFEGQVEIPIFYRTALADIHAAIALSYLKAANLSVALLLNFAPRSLEYKRVTLKQSPRSSA